MLKIKDIYKSLDYEKEVFFQAKNKSAFLNIMSEIEKIIENDLYNCMGKYIKETFSYKDVYFMVGHWRNGIFKVITPNDEFEIDILSDTKESPYEQVKHSEMINKCIDILDEYRNDIKKSRVKYDDNYNIVKVNSVEKVD